MIRRVLLLVVALLCTHPALAGVAVFFDSPTATTFTAPATFTVATQAEAWGDGEWVTSHTLYRDGVEIATGSYAGSGVNAATATVSNLPVGTYTFQATAITNLNARKTVYQTVTVNPPPVPPTVQLGAIVGSPYIAPATLGLSASASDSDGSITKVEFFAGSTLLATDTVAPYEFTWGSVGAGTYSITARAHDNSGRATTSAASSVTINPSVIKGNFDSVSVDSTAAYLQGWACSTGQSQSIDVHVYVGGPAGTGTYLRADRADKASEPAVAAACQSTGTAYRFSIPLSNALRQPHAGKAIYIHGISPVGQPNSLISCSGCHAVPHTKIATMVAQTVPSTMVAGQSYAVSVQMRNDGSAVWRASEGYKLGSQNPANNTVWGPSRVELTGDVANGGIANFHFTAKAPATAGSYNFQWMMLQEGASWIPSIGANQAVRVVSGSISATPSPCEFPAGTTTCTATVNWSSTAADAEVWITDSNNANAQLFARAQNGSQNATNITTATSRFHLKAGGVTIATTDVRGFANPPPVVQITAPAAGVQGIAPASLLLRASATDANGIASVSFYSNGGVINTDTAAPYEFSWGNVPAGTYNVHAVAVDTKGEKAATPAVAVTVNTRPTVQLTSPSAGANGIAPASVAMSANAADTDDGVASVSFYANGTLLNTDATAPYAYTWGGAAAGSYNIHAVVRDTRGATAATPAVAIAIVAPVVNPGSSTRYYVYDQHERLCKVVEPETRATVMDYDAAGNLAWSASGLELLDTTAGACNRTDTSIIARKVSRTYDARNRLETMTVPDELNGVGAGNGIGNGAQVWKYTATGLPQEITTYNEGGTQTVVNSYVYNRRGLLTGETQKHDLYTWSVGQGYDRNGHRASLVYPSGMGLTFAPNALGQPTQVASNVRTYASGVAYHPNGAIRQFSYGNGVVHTMTQNARLLPEHVVSSGGVLDFTYAFDASGNVGAIYDVARGAHYDRTMSYDRLDRLETATSPSFGGDGTHRYAYDKLDNLLSWTSTGGKDLAEYYYEPGTHRLISIRNSKGSAVVGMGYDPQGNLDNKNGKDHNFDFGNRLREIVGLETYRYDGHGRRIWAQSSAGKIFSLYGQDGTLLWERDERTGKQVDHLYLNGTQIAQRSRPIGSETETVRFQHTDALGSPVAVTDEAGKVVEYRAYEPYGASLEGAKQGVGYTGHVMDAATGLTYMQQRYYDPTIGRFLSVDPVTALDNGDMRHFNRYAYAFNNPYKFTDPDGRAAICLVPGPMQACMAAGAVVVDVVVKVATIAGALWVANEAIPTPETPTSESKPGDAFPDRPLPRDPKTGEPVPDPEAAGAPHTQLGTRNGKKGKYPQSREFDAEGNEVKTTDWTDHGRPNDHPNPHDHVRRPNPSGGTPQRGKPEPSRRPEPQPKPEYQR